MNNTVVCHHDTGIQRLKIKSRDWCIVRTFLCFKNCSTFIRFFGDRAVANSWNHEAQFSSLLCQLREYLDLLTTLNKEWNRYPCRLCHLYQVKESTELLHKSMWKLCILNTILGNFS